ncbi:Serine/threonine-protein kinase/endoribonuclease ire-1 [Geodia barretti]|uniref:Serine/threonine-protein kinase/endoribonuclease ire-1 n=1 Tax=Geodia barretti TaxID=519541 RepID=A0AA35RR21_GEOBA|nr:Serine/threonine-protein kinase/endoribonuclease ire-1 [Geodia barretti]
MSADTATRHSTQAVRAPMLVESSDPKIILSLLDGNVLSIDINTGIVLWSLSEDPILSIPDINAYRLNFLPNPQDGSIYFYNNQNLERLPLTIPELVHMSPMRSADGLLYTGY